MITDINENSKTCKYIGLPHVKYYNNQKIKNEAY